MKLLIVEDEPRIGQYLQQGLSEAGFAVDLCSDGAEGELLALSGDHDLLILTARDAVEDRIRTKVDDEFPRRLIHTVRGMGYVLEERDA